VGLSSAIDAIVRSRSAVETPDLLGTPWRHLASPPMAAPTVPGLRRRPPSRCARRSGAGSAPSPLSIGDTVPQLFRSPPTLIAGCASRPSLPSLNGSSSSCRAADFAFRGLESVRRSGFCNVHRQPSAPAWLTSRPAVQHALDLVEADSAERRVAPNGESRRSGRTRYRSFAADAVAPGTMGTVGFCVSGVPPAWNDVSVSVILDAGLGRKQRRRAWLLGSMAPNDFCTPTLPISFGGIEHALGGGLIIKLCGFLLSDRDALEDAPSSHRFWNSQLPRASVQGAPGRLFRPGSRAGPFTRPDYDFKAKSPGHFSFRPTASHAKDPCGSISLRANKPAGRPPTIVNRAPILCPRPAWKGVSPGRMAVSSRGRRRQLLRVPVPGPAWQQAPRCGFVGEPVGWRWPRKNREHPPRTSLELIRHRISNLCAGCSSRAPDRPFANDVSAFLYSSLVPYAIPDIWPTRLVYRIRPTLEKQPEPGVLPRPKPRGSP